MHNGDDLVLPLIRAECWATVRASVPIQESMKQRGTQVLLVPATACIIGCHNSLSDNVSKGPTSDDPNDWETGLSRIYHNGSYAQLPPIDARPSQHVDDDEIAFGDNHRYIGTPSMRASIKPYGHRNLSPHQPTRPNKPAVHMLQFGLVELWTRFSQQPLQERLVMLSVPFRETAHMLEESLSVST